MTDLTASELEKMDDETLLRTIGAYLITAWTLADIADRQGDPQRGDYLKAAMELVALARAFEKRIF